MWKYFNVFILLFCSFLSKCISEDTIQARRHKNQVSFRKQNTNDNYTYIEAEKSFYKYHATGTKWHGAKEVCAQEGASLFFPENKDEADAVIAFWKNYTKTRADKTWVFVGINDLVREGVYTTIDGRPVNDVYINWRRGEPNNYFGEDCVMLNQAGFYNDWPCKKLEKFICKKSAVPPRPSEQNRTTTSSDIQMYDVSKDAFMFWPNATVPFYINPDHFDDEQAMVILKSITMFRFETCIKFTPVMVAPSEGQHVMTFINPEGIMRCKIETRGHSNFNPHLILLGYNCLHSPDLDMIIMRALGLPFEHNRPNRDLFIDVLVENIEPSFVQLFAKEPNLPREFHNIPYDQHSIMHFGEREYSKNGHRTIIFKDLSFRQDRKGLTPNDIKKIALIYEPECRNRDRAENVAISKTYPGVRRLKREIIEPPASKSLRVNPNITPPPHIFAKVENTEKPQEIVAENVSNDTTESLNTLGIVKETDRIIELVYQISALALNNAREKYCNVTSNTTSEFKFRYEKAENKTKASDVLGIRKIIADFAKSIVDDAASNSTEFCQNSETVEAYQSQCKLENDARCPKYEAVFGECVINKNPNTVNDKMKTDGEVRTTTLKPNRRKREATFKDTISKSTEEIKENKEQKPTDIKDIGEKKTNLKEKVQAMRKERLNEINKDDSTTKSEVVSSTTDSIVKDDKKEPTRRKFSEKRYEVHKSREASDWDESDTSLDKHIEPQKTLNNEELFKKVLKQGVGSVFDTEKDNKKSVEEVKIVEKEEQAAELSAESANSNADHEASKEEKVAVTKTRKKYKKNYESSEEVESAEIEETTTKRIARKVKRMDKRRMLPKTVELNKLNREFYSERKWPDGVVIYVVAKLPDYDLEDLRNRLATVNSILMEKTCVKLREVDATEAQGFDDYLILDTSADYVTGRVGGKQNFGSIELFEGGHHKQHTAMMVMAMLGFYFEVSRHDRDRHIRVHNRHIRADKLHHYEKIRKEATLDVPYDYKSATHPAWQFWRRVGKRGISTVATYKEQDPDGSVMRTLGQHPELLSETDIIKINSVYGVECFQSNRANKKSVRMLDEDDDVIQ